MDTVNKGSTFIYFHRVVQHRVVLKEESPLTTVKYKTKDLNKGQPSNKLNKGNHLKLRMISCPYLILCYLVISEVKNGEWSCFSVT